MSDGSARFTPFTMEEKTMLSWALGDFRKMRIEVTEYPAPNTPTKRILDL